MPHAAPKPCPNHPAVLLGPNQKCPHCPTHKWGNDRERGNRHERGYGNAWERLRAIVLARDNYLCQVCLEDYKITPATEVDHIIPKSKGGTDDPDNLQSICTDCHRVKTEYDKHGTIKGSTVDGTPMDATHHWHKKNNNQ